ncbi:MAG: toll/interleukin-1 receptor domain-containing protein [Terracidiphilus sp.]
MKVFFSYSWDSEAHKEWVRNFADTLIRFGVDVMLDQYDLPIGGDRFKFMETGIRNARCVLCICTPEYVQKANERTKGVGVETTILTPHFFEDQSTKEFIPILRKRSSGVQPTPDYLASRIFVDFTADQQFSERMEELLRHLHQKPRHEKPRLGSVPDFEKSFRMAGSGNELTTAQLYERYKNALAAGWNDPEFLLNYGKLCFIIEKDEEAQSAFQRVLALDRQFSSIEEIDETVNRLARSKEPFEMSLTARKALIHLGMIDDVDDYVLDSVYSSTDPELLMMAGKYFLGTYNADIPLAVDYFLTATERVPADSPLVKECDEALYSILMENRALYPTASWDYIKQSVARWNDHKISLM